MTKERVGNAAKPAKKMLTSNGEAIASALHPSSLAVVVVVAVARLLCLLELAGPRLTPTLPRPSTEAVESPPSSPAPPSPSSPSG